jgi:hypothetical protein
MKRNTIIKLVDSYMQDSIVISSIFRVIRKLIQVLSNSNTNLLNAESVNVNPKDFALKFKVN